MSVFRFILLLPVIVASCRQIPESLNTKRSGESNIIKYAERLTIEERNGLTLVSIKNPWQGSNSAELRYILLKDGQLVPDDLKHIEHINVPVRNIVCMSATHLAMMTALGEEKRIIGLSGKDLVYNEKIISLIMDNDIQDVGYEASLNNELLLKMNPDLMMMYGIGAESTGYTSKLSESGIKIIYNADYLETDALGKAEWIKLFGVLTGREDEAAKIFNDAVSKYDSIKNVISMTISHRPSVLLGLPYNDTWYISPGNSYISRLITDAGGKYLWDDIESDISMPTSVESVYHKAREADFWLNAGTSLSQNDILQTDERFGELRCFENIYNNNKRMNSLGGNDYWELGTVYPHLILLDMAAILHPEVFPQHELLFYHKL